MASATVMRALLRDRGAILACVLVLALSLATVYDQFEAQIPYSPGGNPHLFLERNQTARNYGTLHGLTGDPWQYRLASEWVAKEFRLAARGLGFREPAVAGFLSLRLIQNAAIFG